MKRRAFGKTNLMVSEFGLGCARIGGIMQGSAGQYLNLLAAARDAGIDFFDTADMYSQGESEALVGRALRKQRSRVVIATKAGYCLPARRRFVARLKPLVRPVIQLLKIRRQHLPSGSRGTVTQNFSADYLQQAVEASLKRLRTDYIDVLQLHSPPLEVVERGDWLPVLERLQRAGKVRYFGVACDSVEVGEAALRQPGVASIQYTLNLLEPSGERLFTQAAEHGAGGIARETLANGLLVKRRGDIDLAAYCQSDAEREKRERQLTDVARRAEESRASVARLALDYASQSPGVSVALVGARSAEQLLGTLRAAGRLDG